MIACSALMTGSSCLYRTHGLHTYSSARLHGDCEWSLPLLGRSLGVGLTPPNLWITDSTLPSQPLPLNVNQLYSYFHCHPDPWFALYMLNGLQNGFRIGFAHTTSSLVSTVTNHPSAMRGQVSLPIIYGMNYSSVGSLVRFHLRLLLMSTLALLALFPNHIQTSFG